MANKKAQGISLTFIVIAALAVLVLVLVASFTVGGLGGFFSRLTQAGQETVGESDLTLAKSTCTSLCAEARSVTNPGQWSNTNYCRRTYAFDLDQDGTVESEETGVNCWEAPVSEDCLVTMTDLYGGTAACDDGDCEAGCPPMICSGTIVCTGTTQQDCSPSICWNGTTCRASVGCGTLTTGSACLAQEDCRWVQS